MPESRVRKKAPFTPPAARSTARKPNPRWYAPLMVVLMVVGLLFCLAFVVISFSLRPQAESGHALIKADRLVRTAGEPHKAN